MALAPFQVLNSYMWLVAYVLEHENVIYRKITTQKLVISLPFFPLGTLWPRRGLDAHLLSLLDILTIDPILSSLKRNSLA